MWCAIVTPQDNRGVTKTRGVCNLFVIREAYNAAITTTEGTQDANKSYQRFGHRGNSGDVDDRGG
jgi:hypothetical protein